MPDLDFLDRLHKTYFDPIISKITETLILDKYHPSNTRTRTLCRILLDRRNKIHRAEKSNDRLTRNALLYLNHHFNILQRNKNNNNNRYQFNVTVIYHFEDLILSLEVYQEMGYSTEEILNLVQKLKEEYITFKLNCLDLSNLNNFSGINSSEYDDSIASSSQDDNSTASSSQYDDSIARSSQYDSSSIASSSQDNDSRASSYQYDSRASSYQYDSSTANSSQYDPSIASSSQYDSSTASSSQYDSSTANSSQYDSSKDNSISLVSNPFSVNNPFSFDNLSVNNSSGYFSLFNSSLSLFNVPMGSSCNFTSSIKNYVGAKPYIPDGTVIPNRINANRKIDSEKEAKIKWRTLMHNIATIDWFKKHGYKNNIRSYIILLLYGSKRDKFVCRITGFKGSKTKCYFYHDQYERYIDTECIIYLMRPLNNSLPKRINSNN